MTVRRRSIGQQREYDSERRWDILGDEDSGDILCMKEITQCKQDDFDTENFVSEVLVGALLEHFLFKCLILFVIISNAIIISIQTSNPVFTKKYEIAFSVCEHIILSAFTWEILVKWFYGFAVFWRNGWNILDCVVTTALLLGPRIFPQGRSVFKVMRVLRVVRSVSNFASMRGVARMMQVIWQSLPDLANIFLLLIVIMMVFAVFGVTLFSTSVPSAFGDLTSSLYTLFICITQDGWMDIYERFKEVGASQLYGASVYFFIFLTIGAFIFGNLFGAVVTTNLEMSMTDMDEKGGDNPLMITPEDNTQMMGNTMVHVEEVVTKTKMTKRQKPWKGTYVESLRLETFEELILVLSTMQTNLKEYKSIRNKLDKIVEEVHSLPFNREQENAVIMRDQRAAMLKNTILKDDIAMGRTGDMLSTLMTLEKAHVINSGTDSPALFQKGLRHEAMRRMSVSNDKKQETAESSTKHK
ncbi:cation channel sperm-associated protein 4-like [Sardina pilchardus]|uniref:cation channel sperm-associated protein 4-like n=1 Tax=Sardina pilchardus TaxID=27697 RepID=UPI002E15A210